MRRNWILAYDLFIAFFDLNTRKVPASIPDMTACSLSGAPNKHESFCSKTVNQPNMLLVSIRFKICCRSLKVSLQLKKALVRTRFPLTCAQNSSFKQQWVNNNVIRVVTRMDITTHWNTLRFHSLLKFKEGMITDKPEYICAENEISSHLLNKKNRIKKCN